MCIRKIPTFGICAHSGATNPGLTYIDVDGCATKDCENPREQTEYRKDEQCFDCVGIEPFRERRDGPTVFFKHCFQSEICDHEFEHFLTEIERDPFEPEVVLVTPIPNDICPDCKANGYDRNPGITNPLVKTASVMPRDFEGITRKSMATVVLDTLMVPMVSRRPSNIYDPSAARMSAASLTPAAKPGCSTQAASASKAPKGSRVPSSSTIPSSSHHLTS